MPTVNNINAGNNTDIPGFAWGAGVGAGGLQYIPMQRQNTQHFADLVLGFDVNLSDNNEIPVEIVDEEDCNSYDEIIKKAYVK